MKPRLYKTYCQAYLGWNDGAVYIETKREIGKLKVEITEGCITYDWKNMHIHWDVKHKCNAVVVLSGANLICRYSWGTTFNPGDEVDIEISPEHIFDGEGLPMWDELYKWLRLADALKAWPRK